MIRRFFALLVLAAFAAAGLYYLKSRDTEVKTPQSFDQVAKGLKDAAITGAVKTAFGLNKNLRSLPIEVHTEDAVVTLRGDVARSELKDTAERVASSVPDVRQVVNHVRVTGAKEDSPRPDRTLTETLDDRALEVQVRLALSLNRDLKGADIGVDVFKKQVTLSGVVRAQTMRSLAVQVTRDTPGVSSVTDHLRAAGEDGQTKP